MADRPDDTTREANTIGPAGANADPDPGNPVSGMPAGGPYDLGSTAHDVGKSDDPNAQSVLDPLGMGMDAYRAGAGREACPYAADSDEGARWLEGWDHQKNAEAGPDGA